MYFQFEGKTLQFIFLKVSRKRRRKGKKKKKINFFFPPTVKNQGDTIVAAEWSADGYNQSGVLRVLTSESPKPLWETSINGAGAGYGSVALKTDGSHFAIVANVNNSYVIPGHAQVLCFSKTSSKPTHTIDLPIGEFAAQAAATMSNDLRVAFAAGESSPTFFFLSFWKKRHTHEAELSFPPFFILCCLGFLKNPLPFFFFPNLMHFDLVHQYQSKLIKCANSLSRNQRVRC